ncbi:uncharacterized protein LOC111069360 [Drosophila obscura]|uniref:uncharacterized protein LOC111069360 n=1 Tax=Drosophila obscura TaxID=7282 RepID=UPI001BB20540|nr:uncharacterized protein LOC111069360 [Drosophila obscura]
MDVLKEKSGGHSIEANVQQQQQQQQQMPVSLVQRCNYEVIIPNPCLATGKPAWPAESQFSTALHGVDVLQSPDEPKTAFRKLKVRRNPIQCPDADCQGTCFVSDILSHIISNHSTVTIDRMGLRQTRTCFLDANETRLNKAKCHQIFVVQGMIISAEGDALQHQLPVLLMSARIRHRDVIGHCRSGSSVPECEQLNDDSQEMLLLWLTSLKPTNQRVLGTLAVRAPDRPDTMMVTTARTYDIRDSHELGALLASPSIMIIPHTVLQRLSRKRKQLIVIQAQIH